MAILPTMTARVPAKTSELAAAALRNVGGIQRQAWFKRLERSESYYRGTSYDGRRYNWDGSAHVDGDASGEPAFPPWKVPFGERRPLANYRLGRIIVRRLTALMYGEGDSVSFTSEDEVTEDVLAAIAEMTSATEKFVAGRDLGGQHGTAVWSYQWLDGVPRIEVHSRKATIPLEWLDPVERIPHHVIKLYPIEGHEVRDGRLEELDTWAAREWRGPRYAADGVTVVEPGLERFYRYTPPTSDDKDGEWRVLSEGPLTECPVVFAPNEEAEDSVDGLPDYEGLHGAIDQTVALFNATILGTLRNADPTLVVMDDKGAGDDDLLTGGDNVIFSKGGAEYLHLPSDAVKAGVDAATYARGLTLEQADIVILDPDKAGGKAESGEALRRIMLPMLAKAALRRTTYGRAHARVLEGLLRLGRAFLEAGEVLLPVFDPNGQAVLDPATGVQATKAGRFVLRLPPRVVESETEDECECSCEACAGGSCRACKCTGCPSCDAGACSGCSAHASSADDAPKSRLVPRASLGAGTRVRVTWGPFLPMSTQEVAQLLAALVAASGGPVIAPETAIKRVAQAFPGIIHADEEWRAILDAVKDLQEAKAGDMAGAALGTGAYGAPALAAMAAARGKAKGAPPKGAPPKGNDAAAPKGDPGKAE